MQVRCLMGWHYELGGDALWTERLGWRVAGLAKQSIETGALPLEEGCVIEAGLFQQALYSDTAREKMRRFLELGGQTREGELRVAELSGEVAGLG
ncbi:hypothetical protein NSE01_10380 [Novosphingobium sediminis]|uniref:Uncharacterized protein n=1 Tax=Novosphingobium sediminis TaxID=707214 RepID=A0A512AHN3_9SPHN|nr:hypothetical protein [Novosphingobium sediminis]GEN99205.1 hypothetical protein NSE01_10380 [Novosphingobium sediminis]